MEVYCELLRFQDRVWGFNDGDVMVWSGLGFGPGPHRTAPQVQCGLGCGPQTFLEVRFGVCPVLGISCTRSELDCTSNLTDWDFKLHSTAIEYWYYSTVTVVTLIYYVTAPA
jgi:hypothetical protein